MTPRQTRWGLLWLAVYATLMALTVWGLAWSRQRVLLRFGTPDAVAEWRRWAAETRQPDPGQPVARRPVKADEPPSLVLMRDHFTAILAVSLVVASMVFAFLSFVAWGVSRGHGADRNGASVAPPGT